MKCYNQERPENRAFLVIRKSFTIQNSFSHLLGTRHHIQYPTRALALGADEPQTFDGRFMRWWLIAHHRGYSTEGMMSLVGAFAKIFRREN